MYSIYKYSWSGNDVPLFMPKGARILSVQVQHNEVKFWALVDPQAPPVPRKVKVYGTGWDLPSGDPGAFLGTVQLDEGRFIFHFFDEGEVR